MNDNGSVRASTQTHDPLRIAAGLLKNDSSLLPILLAVLALPALLDPLVARTPDSARTFIMFSDRVLQLLVVSFISLRWRRRLESSQGPRVRWLPAAARITFIGLSLSVLVTIPMITMFLSGDGVSSIISVVLLTFGCWYALRVYFYFAAASIFGMSLGSSVVRSIEVGKRDSTAALRSMIAPGALAILLIALAMAPAPDGRSLMWLTIASCMEGVFWLLSTYTGLAWALIVFNESDWRGAGLDPYRSERLDTIQAQGSIDVAKWLSPKFGLVIALAAVGVWISNTVRQLHLLPAASVSVSHVWVADYSVKVELSVSDPEHHFRGFSPFAFSIASKTGFQQAQRLTSVSKSYDGKEMLIGLDGDGTQPQSVFLTFQTGKTAESMKETDNMWLWYKFEPFLPLQQGLFRDAPATGGAEK